MAEPTHKEGWLMEIGPYIRTEEFSGYSEAD
jgi:hypothetical protein